MPRSNSSAALGFSSNFARMPLDASSSPAVCAIVSKYFCNSVGIVHSPLCQCLFTLLERQHLLGMVKLAQGAEASRHHPPPDLGESAVEVGRKAPHLEPKIIRGWS